MLGIKISNQAIKCRVVAMFPVQFIVAEIYNNLPDCLIVAHNSRRISAVGTSGRAPNRNSLSGRIGHGPWVWVG